MALSPVSLQHLQTCHPSLIALFQAPRGVSFVENQPI